MNMTTKTEDTNITFNEFCELCEEAGISTDNAEQMEADFRAGRALADVTDALIANQEEHPAEYDSGEALDEMDVAITRLDEIRAGADPAPKKQMAVKLAVHAIRYLAEHCHDEGKN